MALAAAGRGDYETFHDLAWRAVQTGPRNDAALMYLLARAQSLSGRPHDALVMLQRLVDMKAIPAEAATSEDFSRVRQLPGWPELEARIAGAAAASTTPAASASAASASAAPAPPAPVTAPAPPAPVTAPTPATPAPAIVPSPAAEALHFSAAPFALGGIAYDAVSARFLFGDRLGRKVIVVGDGANHPVDLARSQSGGFQDVTAIEIDSRRGDLWVASAAPAGGEGALHKLQLVSGRLLKAFPLSADAHPVRFVDLAVTAAGTVIALDAENRQLLALHPGRTSLERVVTINVQEPVSVAVGDDESTAYVAHRDGVMRVNLRTRTTANLAMPKGTPQRRFERIRWHRHALIAVGVDGDGSRRIVRLDLNGRDTAVTRVTTLAPVSGTGQTFATISGDDLLFIVASDGAASVPSDGVPPALADFVAYRVPLR